MNTKAARVDNFTQSLHRIPDKTWGKAVWHFEREFLFKNRRERGYRIDLCKVFNRITVKCKNSELNEMNTLPFSNCVVSRFFRAIGFLMPSEIILKFLNIKSFHLFFNELAVSKPYFVKKSSSTLFVHWFSTEIPNITWF